MPKSKRDKKISLTKTKKKGLEHKKQLITDIQTCVDGFKQIFVISVQNMRNSKLREVRLEWSNSRFFFGKNKVMIIALGKERQDEYQMNLHKIGRRLQGQTGLLFTDVEEEEVKRWFVNYCVDDFARSGNTATHTIKIDAGPIPPFSHSIEPQLRQLGLPTSLDRGVVTLLKEYTVCQKGSALLPEQARILKLFNYKMAKFCITVEAMWMKEGKKFKSFESSEVAVLLNGNKKEKDDVITLTAANILEGNGKTISTLDDDEDDDNNKMDSDIENNSDNDD